MRNFTLLILFLAPFSLSAVTKTSIAAGSWSNPAIWSPAGVPTAGDDIIVNTGVTFFGMNINSGSALFHVTSNGSLNGLNTDTLTFGGDYFLNESYIGCGMFAVGATDSVVNSGFMEFQEVAQSGTYLNYGNMCVAVLLATSDDFTNNGDVACDSWVNSGVVTGTGGQFCIVNNFINSDQISGTIDICDASPGGFGDQNLGTISPSVTNCAAGPCGSCIQPGFGENSAQINVTVAPHPVQSTSLFTFDLPQINDGSMNTFVVTDVAGRVVKSISFTGSRLEFDRSGMESGVYFYQLVKDHSIVLTGKMIVQ